MALMISIIDLLSGIKKIALDQTSLPVCCKTG
jgi:hypothetical protein